MYPSVSINIRALYLRTTQVAQRLCLPDHIQGFLDWIQFGLAEIKIRQAVEE